MWNRLKKTVMLWIFFNLNRKEIGILMRGLIVEIHIFFFLIYHWGNADFDGESSEWGARQTRVGQGHERMRSWSQWQSHQQSEDGSWGHVQIPCLALTGPLLGFIFPPLEILPDLDMSYAKTKRNNKTLNQKAIKENSCGWKSLGKLE